MKRILHHSVSLFIIASFALLSSICADPQCGLPGTDFTGATRVEINGIEINREVTFQPEQNQIVVHGSKAQLTLRDSKHQVTVIRKGARSNTIKVKVK